MAWAAIAVGVVSAGVTMYNNKENRDAAEKAATDANEKQAIETAKLEEQKAEYKAMKFENPYENMENVYEDLTVNQQQAQFQAQQGAQTRANVMQDLRGAAGGSGIAGLAQAMANQGQLQTQQISASIGQQEAANQALKAGEAGRIQGLERQGEMMEKQFEIDKQSTLLGMQMGESTAANVGAQSAALNQQQVDAASRESNAAALGNLAGTVAGADYSGLRKAAPDGTTGSTTGGYPGLTVEQARTNALTNQGLVSENAPNTQIKIGKQKVFDEESGTFIWV